MKKIVLLLSCFLFLNSCLSEDSSYKNYYLELVAVETVDIPQQFMYDQTYNITLEYKKKSTCHHPNGIYMNSVQNTRVVAVENIVYQRSDCSTQVPDNDLLHEVSFELKATQEVGSKYIFKFFKGYDVEGQGTFLVVEVPVVEYEDVNP